MPEMDFPLDLEATGYAYVERPNPVLLSLLSEHVLARTSQPTILDVGCGAGANARSIREIAPRSMLVGIEPNPRAAELARQVHDEVFQGSIAEWNASSPSHQFDAVLLSDVLEHMADPVGFLRALTRQPALENATFLLSVPNCGVWYHRVRTLLGRFDYDWSGLYDRTHLRFFTRRSIRRLLEYCDLRINAERCSPSLVQSLAPLLRRFFSSDVSQGNHLALLDHPGYRVYQRAVEPVETQICQLWPALLGFQIVLVAEHA